MEQIIYILGIILAVAIAILFVVGLVATAKVWFDLVAEYWQNSNRFKNIRRKGCLKKLYSAAYALRYWSHTYKETQGMNLVEMEDFYRRMCLTKNKEK